MKKGQKKRQRKTASATTQETKKTPNRFAVGVVDGSGQSALARYTQKKKRAFMVHRGITW
jgi:hypothetical protein